MFPYFLSFLTGYLVGSFPTGYLLVKRKSNVDITKSGSGNVGALNARVVTGSKRIGITVGIVDGLKGVLAIAIAAQWSTDFPVLSVGLFAAVMGHNYPVWLAFKGGRGLATACGGLLLLAGGYVIVWCTIWAVLKWQRQTILGANLFATIATPLVLLLIPGPSLEAITAISGSAADVRWLAFAMSLLFVLSHRDAIREMIPKGETSA